jgi:hypothetical protein
LSSLVSFLIYVLDAGLDRTERGKLASIYVSLDFCEVGVLLIWILRDVLTRFLLYYWSREPAIDCSKLEFEILQPEK